MNYWFLAANPRYFDINRYLENERSVYWGLTSSQHNKIKAGDVTFFWRYKGSWNKKSIPGNDGTFWNFEDTSGVIGIGRIIEKGTYQYFKNEIEPEDKYWRKTEDEPEHPKEWYCKAEVGEIRLTSAKRMLIKESLFQDNVIIENNYRFGWQSRVVRIVNHNIAKRIIHLWKNK